VIRVSPKTQFGFLGFLTSTFRALDIVFCLWDPRYREARDSRSIHVSIFFSFPRFPPPNDVMPFVPDGEKHVAALIPSRSGLAVHHFFFAACSTSSYSLVDRTHWLSRSRSDSLGALLSYMYALQLLPVLDFAGLSAFAIG